MKKVLKVFMVLLVCFTLTTLSGVKAANLNIKTVSNSAIIGVNTFRMNNPAAITLDKNSIVAHNCSFKTYSGTDSDKDGDGSFRGASASSYWMYVFNASDSWLQGTYRNVGWYNDGNGERAVNGVLTISNYNSNGATPNGGNWLAGLNKVGLMWILLTSNNGAQGLNSDVQLTFYYADDPTKQPIDLGEAYIGVGGNGSEKRVWNGSQGENDGWAAQYINDLNPSHKPGINGHQWEWVTYDTQVGSSLKVYKAANCILSYVTPGQVVHCVDSDRKSYDYGWGQSSANCTFDVNMANPTGYNVITNAGNRYDTKLYDDINYFLDMRRYSNTSRDKLAYMVEVGKTNNTQGLIGVNARADGQNFSVYKFKSGKDVGSIELGMEPITIGTFVKKPGKNIVEPNGNLVKSTTRREGEDLVYRISQQVGNMNDYSQQITQRSAFTKFVVTDPLPPEVEFVNASVSLRGGSVISSTSNNNDNCRIAYNAATHTVTFTFGYNYLQQMAYRGEFYDFNITTKVKDLTNAPEYIISNKAKVEFGTPETPNFDPIETDEVVSDILYDILTRAQNATISNRILSIKGGTNGNVVTFVPQLGYYIDSVEWQTQSSRYTDYNADIPGTNKVKVPETKDGSESAYKFVTTMNGEIPTGAINSNFTPGNLNYDPFGRTTYTFNNLDNNHYVKVIAKPMKMVIRVNKEDLETGKTTQGDAKFVNAEYTIYSSYNAQTGAVSNPVEVLTLDANGFAQSSELPLGTYYVKETKAPEGYLIDEQVYTISQTPAQQAMTREKVSYFDVLSKEQVIKNTIEITKYLEQTDSTPKQKLSGVVFSATLKSDTSKVYYSQPTDANGYTKFADLPYGTYTITETTIPDVVYDGQFMIDPTTARIKSFDVYIEKDKSVAPTYSYDITDVAKKMQITIYKEDVVTGSNPQGDADLAGAEYTLYRDEACTDAIETITTIKDETTGKYFAKSGWYLVGTYYIKETKAPVGYLIDEEKYTISQVPGEQTVERTYHSTTSKDEVMKGKVSVIKYDDFIDTTKDASSQGAILRLTLNSKPEKYYDLTIDSVGRGDFNDTILVAYAPYTIPYGVYTVTEVKASDKGEHTRFFIQPEIVEIDHNEDSEYRIFSDDPIKAYIRIQKTDADTGKPVELEGAKFKIWNVAKKEWVSQMIYPSGEIIEEFTANETGLVVTPDKIPTGEYIIYETDAPEGYYFNNEWRLPENPADIGNAQKGGKLISFNDVALGIEKAVSGDYELYYDVEMPNPPQKAYLKITKTGDALTNVTTVTTEYGEKYTPKYEVAGIAGVTYQVVADGDIKSPDGKQTYVKSGTIVDTVITDSQGIAVTKDLYVGNYILKEVSAPAGYIVKAEGQKITLKNGNKLVKSAENTISLTNDRQKLYLTFEKQFEDVEYSFDAENKYTATFGVYTTVDIKNNKGEIIIPKGGLVDLISIAGKTATVKSNIDLPAANYEVRELKVEFPYSVNKATRVFNLQYKNTQDLTITYTGEKYVNKPELSEVNFLKINSKVYNANKAAIDELVAKGDIAAFNELASKYGLEGTKYHVYYKDDKGEYVQLKTRANADSEWEPVEFVSGTTGTDKLMLPSYTYYLKEIEAPVDYLIDPDYNEVKVSGEVAIAIVHDKKEQGKITVIHKDIDTKEDLYPTKEYEDDINEPYVTVDREKEINAKYNYDIEDLKFYELVEEKYPENAEGVYKKEEQTVIYYYKKIMSNIIVKYVDDDTEEEIADGFEYIGFIGEDYETFKKDIDGYEFVVEKYPANATGKFERDTIVVIYRYNKKNVETGDINVMALVSLMIVSFVGIKLVSAKKRALNK